MNGDQSIINPEITEQDTSKPINRYLSDDDLYHWLNNPSWQVGAQDKPIGQVYVMHGG